MKKTNVVVSMPDSLYRTLLTLRSESYTPSGYICVLLRRDFRARRESGWTPGKGWMPQDEGESNRRQVTRPPAKTLSLVE